jgi:hypothetical protein
MVVGIQMIRLSAGGLHEQVDLRAPFRCGFVQIDRSQMLDELFPMVKTPASIHQAGDVFSRQYRDPGGQHQVNPQPEFRALCLRFGQFRNRGWTVHHGRGRGDDALQMGAADAFGNPGSVSVIVCIDDEIFGHAIKPFEIIFRKSSTIFGSK